MLAPNMTHGAVKVQQHGEQISVTFIAASRGKTLFPTGFTTPSVRRELVPEDTWFQKNAKKAQNLARRFAGEPSNRITSAEKSAFAKQIQDTVYDQFKRLGIEVDEALAKSTRNKESGKILSNLNKRYKSPDYKGTVILLPL